MTEPTAEKPRFRSPPYPATSLAKAIERAKQLYGKAQHYPISAAVLADAWDYSPKSGGTFATAAALIHFGLMSDEGSGAQRKFRLTDDAQRIVRDAEPNSVKRKEAIGRAALLPKIFAELWSSYGDGAGLADSVLKNHLTLDRSDAGQAAYSDAAADEVIQTYRETVLFAGLSKNATVAPEEKPVAPVEELKSKTGTQDPGRAEVGDHIQWTSGGVDQFKVPPKVTKVSDDGNFVWVFGSPTGIPMNETAVVRPIAPAAISTGPTVEPAKGSQSSSDFTVYLAGGRLQITADVDAEGVAKLKEILSKYEDILKMLK